jgi:hypothetical protein
METGDLVCFRGTGVVPAVIRWKTKSAWGHCGIIFTIQDIPMVLEAKPLGGVSLRSLQNRMADDPTIFNVGRKIDQKDALLHAGEEYSMKDAILAGFDIPGECAGWNCAEFAAHIYGLESNVGWTPQSLLEHLYGKGNHEPA